MKEQILELLDQICHTYHTLCVGSEYWYETGYCVFLIECEGFASYRFLQMRASKKPITGEYILELSIKENIYKYRENSEMVDQQFFNDKLFNIIDDEIEFVLFLQEVLVDII